jgi:hypothetical protein
MNLAIKAPNAAISAAVAIHSRRSRLLVVICRFERLTGGASAASRGERSEPRESAARAC